ncbi:hypothetical protein QQ008_13835 [Fulvivirgaceae bacterium BMA10]|uniref:Uncharacterized protein n=1 Tax=Splendidivirga corallicola TaxID=3051826 RepID=A0ABT8KP08_9BACT|nr:hypothetical protein [Fulvivirgaceae bacterium BMA10]
MNDGKAKVELFLPDGTAEGLREKIGPSDFKVFHQQLLSLIDDIHVEVQKNFQENTWSSISRFLKCGFI